MESSRPAGRGDRCPVPRQVRNEIPLTCDPRLRWQRFSGLLSPIARQLGGLGTEVSVPFIVKPLVRRPVADRASSYWLAAAAWWPAGVSGLRYVPAVQNPLPDTFITKMIAVRAAPAQLRENLWPANFTGIA